MRPYRCTGLCRSRDYADAWLPCLVSLSCFDGYVGIIPVSLGVLLLVRARRLPGGGARWERSRGRGCRVRWRRSRTGSGLSWSGWGTWTYSAREPHTAPTPQPGPAPRSPSGHPPRAPMLHPQARTSAWTTRCSLTLAGPNAVQRRFRSSPSPVFRTWVIVSGVAGGRCRAGRGAGAGGVWAGG
jgi:hypothetical protein